MSGDNIPGGSPVKYLSTKDTAAIIRKRLKREYPGVRFTVRSKRYAGGSSIDVSWTDGPTGAQVDLILKDYEGSGFDAMIDLKYPKTHYLGADGRVYFRGTSGTQGSAGVVPPIDNSHLADAMPDDVQPVQFLCDFVFGNRRLSRQDELETEAAQFLYAQCRIDNPTGNPRHDRFGNEWLSTWVHRLLLRWEHDRDWSDIFGEVI